jgi:hypothetical protein
VNLKNVEESLKRLQQKKKRADEQEQQQKMSDEDKIRWQIYLDVIQFGQEVFMFKPSICLVIVL